MDPDPQERANPLWYAVRVKSNCEHSVAASIRGRGYEEYLPLYRARRRGPASLKDLYLPLFPGYVFGNFDVNHRLPVLVIPGVVHIVGCGRIPAPVDPAELNAIRSVLASNLVAQPWPFLHSGDRVVLEAGPLRGLEGIICEARGQFRIVVSVTLLQRSVAVEIDRCWVRPIGPYPHRLPPIVEIKGPSAVVRSGLAEG